MVRQAHHEAQIIENTRPILSLSKDEARFHAPSAARATWLPAAKAAPKREAPLENARSLRGACERGRKPGHIYARIVPSASRGPEPPAIGVAVNAAPEPDGRTIERPIRGMPLVRQFLRLSRRIHHGGGNHRQGSCERRQHYARVHRLLLTTNEFAARITTGCSQFKSIGGRSINHIVSNY
jgi:hypothetical protein